MKKRLAVLLPLTFVLAAVAAGCGGGDSDPAPTKAEYITQADAICKSANDEMTASIEDQFGSGQPSQEELAAFATDIMVPNLQGQLDELKALTPPEGESEATAEIYDNLEAGISALEADPAGAIDNNSSLDKATSLSNEYGMTACGAS